MNKFWLTLFLITLFLNPISGSVKADSLTIAVITDLHYLSPELAFEGEALSVFERQTGRNVKDLHEVFDKVLDDLISEEVDILLVTGDITNHGERLSHEGFLEKILPLQESGTQVFVIPGNHDINIQDAKAYRGEFATPADNISKEEIMVKLISS
jgi:3',5'-cyclic AMP phosphodiesterase CpdA